MRKIFLLVGIVISSFILNAGVMFEQTTNTLIVSDYSAESPCTLSQLARMDKIAGWKKVEKTGNQYLVKANLRIGKNDDTETYFQIYPGEELTVRGDMIVSPFWVKGENQDAPMIKIRMKNIINRLTLGSPDVVIGAKLFIDSGNLTTGVVKNNDGNWNQNCWGGQLYAYNSTISNAPGKTWIRYPFWKGNSHVLLNSNIIANGGNLCDGMVKCPYTSISECRLEGNSFRSYGNIAVLGQVWKNCTFTGANIGFRDNGSFHGILENCIIKGNQINFSLTHYNNPPWNKPARLELLDCQIEPGAKPDLLREPNYECKPGFKIPELWESYTVKFQTVPNRVIDISGGPEKYLVKTDQNGFASIALPLRIRSFKRNQKFTYTVESTNNITPSRNLTVHIK